MKLSKTHHQLSTTLEKIFQDLKKFTEIFPIFDLLRSRPLPSTEISQHPSKDYINYSEADVAKGRLDG